MEGLSEVVDDPLVRCQRLLSAQGQLAQTIPGFVSRSGQIELASAIAKSIAAKSILVAEAGTGTGKTFAYLLPCLISGKKTLVSTATKTLQDQLFQKDLPLLVRALGLSIRIQNLKGRVNYLCLHRIELHANEGRFVNPQIAHELGYIRENLPRIKGGERSELPEISEDSSVWPYATSTADNCLAKECQHLQNCFLLKARRRALKADVVIINHHLFFADSCLKEEGFGELLPGVETVVFDEAHQLAEIATHFNGQRLSTRQLRELVDDLLREWPILDLANQPLKQLGLQADEIIDQFLLIPCSEERLTWDQIAFVKEFKNAWEALKILIEDLIQCIEDSGIENRPGLGRCFERLNEIKALVLHFEQSSKKQIRWIERFKNTFVFHSTPFEVADYFKSLLAIQNATYVFTSATLTMGSSFDCFIKHLGLNNAETLMVPSPFDYQQQALLYLPRGLPDPKSTIYYECLLQKALPLIKAFGGRCFFLFTSHRALKLVAQLMANTLDYPLLVQGEEAKPILLARFRELGNAVLLGTATFWEGVDVKGEALSCVIIDKLPFANPADPIVRGKLAYLKSCGLSGFDELSLPNSVLALKQGVGRLIRDTTDRGVLMIADPRLTARNYGQRIFASLPCLPKTRDEQKVLNFINKLALKNEPLGN